MMCLVQINALPDASREREREGSFEGGKKRQGNLRGELSYTGRVEKYGSPLMEANEIVVIAHSQIG
jgi:hypothetical protein